MPKIPILTAQQGPGVLQLPRIPHPAPIVSGFEGLKDFGETLIGIADRQQQQQNDLDYLDATGAYEAGLADLTLTLKENPDYLRHELTFIKGARELSASIRKRYGANPTVTRAFLGYEAKHLPRALVQVRANARQLLGQEQLGRIEEEKESLSLRAAEAATPAARDEVIQRYTSIVDRATARGYYNPLEAAKHKIEFHQKMLSKNMDFLRRTDRAKLRELDRQGAFAELDPNTRLKILEGARADEESEDRRREQIVNEAKEIVLREAYGLANQGLYPTIELEEAIKGNNPFISPQTAAALKERNDNPITGAGSRQIRAIMLDYHLERLTRQQALKALRAVADETGEKNTLLDKAADELMTDKRTERGIRAAEVTAGIKQVEDTLTSQQKPKLPGIIGTMQKNKDEVEKAKARLKIRQGQPVEKVLKEIKDRNAEQLKEPSTVKVPQPLTDILDLTKDKTDYSPRGR